MFRSMTSDVSTVSGFVAQGHQTMHYVSCSPSKIPYGGFSPVRLQTGIGPHPSLPKRWVKREARMRHLFPSLYVASARISGSFSPSLWRDIRTTLAEPSYCGAPVQRPLARLRVMLSRWVIAYYGLIRGSRPTCRLIFFIQQARALRPPSGWARELPQFTPHVFPFVPPSVPRQTQRLPMTVASPLILAFATFAQARHLLLPHAGSRVSCVTRLQGSLHAAARRFARPSPARAFTSKLSSPESPQRDVEYDYMGTQSIPMAGLTPARHAALWAADKERTSTGFGPRACQRRRLFSW